MMLFWVYEAYLFGLQLMQYLCLIQLEIGLMDSGWLF
jgi:hypothetical protein